MAVILFITVEAPAFQRRGWQQSEALSGNAHVRNCLITSSFIVRKGAASVANRVRTGRHCWPARSHRDPRTPRAGTGAYEVSRMSSWAWCLERAPIPAIHATTSPREDRTTSGNRGRNLDGTCPVVVTAAGRPTARRSRRACPPPPCRRRISDGSKDTPEPQSWDCCRGPTVDSETHRQAGPQ